ncbi:MAG: HlyD family type I secretion periplasmic adaptor subunit [Proteobacteria bacterium]|nr:HlyD family type I secretion periplasmic adaptor subunit [Pseudomonadota bacterium]MBU1387597.1 HlyD family type I secretion periplasmic adaptor subunit [Pseudomonadota bacterium]MBU1544188.1 HlyD family type I secretion periplasmic adaptor subunit [Pseudomonadota bacterium]
MMFKIFKKKDDSHLFKPVLIEIEEKPLNPLGRTIFWIILIVILFFSIWLYVGKIDVVVSARGTVMPTGRIKQIQPLNTGIVSKINCKNGDYVKKGDVLVEIDPSTTDPELKSLRKNLLYQQIETERLNALLNNLEFKPDITKYDEDLLAIQTKIYHTAKKALFEQIQSKEKEISKTEEQLKGMESETEKVNSLFEINVQKKERLEKVKDIIAHEKYEAVNNEIIALQNQIKSLGFKTNELNLLKNQLKEEISYARTIFREKTLKDLSDRLREINNLEEQISKIQFINKKQKILSPIDGFVIELFINTIGGVVTSAQKLISIVPSNSSFMIEATVLNKDIGFVKPEMPVSIKIDTFSFQKYGVLKGVVHQISKDSIIDEQLGPIYKINIEPLELSLMVENKPIMITSGLTVTSEIKVGKRRIIEFFVYPLIKYLDEGMSVR